jgi:1-acyl-sn-glycerol-3-phosphate acyltransferase
MSSWFERLHKPTRPRLEQRFSMKRGLLDRFLVWFCKRAVYLLARLFFRLEINGGEKIPSTGPALICPNHESSVDPLLLYALLPDAALYIAYEKHFRRAPFRWIVQFARIILTGGKDQECLRIAYQGLSRGMMVCIFPEGRRTYTGRLMRTRAGARILTSEAQVPMIPVLIEGSLNLWSPIHPGFRPCKIRIRVGDAIFPDCDSSKEDTSVLLRWRESLVQLRFDSLLARQSQSVEIAGKIL